MPRQRPKASDRINLPRSKADEYFDSVEIKPDDQLTSQQVDTSTSQQAISANGQSSEKATEPAPEIQGIQLQSEARPTELPASKSTNQEVQKPTSQQVKKLKKATFQLSEALLKELDTFHLKLQLELGKENTPYKEVIVEEAIAQLLEQYKQNPQKTLKALHFRRDSRH